MKGLIVSVGQKNSLRSSLRASQLSGPYDYALFFVSPESAPHVDEVRGLLLSETITWPKSERIMLVQNPMSIIECYRTVSQDIPAWMHDCSLSAADVTVDFTGGTKSMTAALALYASFNFSSLLYVDGDRDQNGRVITGTERSIPTGSPVEATLFTRWEMWQEYHDATRFRLVAEEAKIFAQRVDTSLLRVLCSIVSKVENVLADWDAFMLPKSYLMSFCDVLDDLAALVNQCHDAGIRKWHGELVGLHGHMSNLHEESTTPSDAWIEDLLANAQRRANREQKYEDAVARLYSSCERLCQQRILKRFGHSTSHFPLTSVPEKLQSEFEKKFSVDKASNDLKFGLVASMKLLRSSGDEVGERFFRKQTPWLGEFSLLDSRNLSILGHGLKPIDVILYEQFWLEMKELWEIDETQLPQVPSLPALPAS